jgi:hypothetical protein
MSNNRDILSKSSPDEKKEFQYAVLMETNGKEFESWYYFLRYEGNEEALKHLSKQLENVDFYVLDELSTFDLDLEHLVSERTAKEMTKLELNAFMFHRKFDGKLKTIDLGFKKKESNEKKIVKCFKTLGIGRIEEYIDEEDIDPEDLASECEEEEDSEEDNDYHYEISDSENESDSSDSEKEKRRKKKDNDRAARKLDKLKRKM